MDKKNSLSFALSQEELFVLLFHFRRSEMAGVDFQVLNDLTDREKNLALAVAERCLLARGFLMRGQDNQIKMIDPVLALVGACLESDRAIILAVTMANLPEQKVYYHFARKMRVVHSIPVAGMHQFIAVEDDKALSASLLSMSVPRNVPDLAGGKIAIPMKVLLEARDAGANGDPDSAFALLRSAGVDETTARLLAESLAVPLLSAAFSLIDNQKQDLTGFSVFGSKKGLWMFTPDQGGELVDIEPVAAKAVARHVDELVSPR